MFSNNECVNLHFTCIHIKKIAISKVTLNHGYSNARGFYFQREQFQTFKEPLNIPSGNGLKTELHVLRKGQ